MSFNNAHINAGIQNAGVATLTDSTVSGNSSVAFAGGIGNAGNMVLLRTTVSANSSDNTGGIFNTGPLMLTNSTISNNMARIGGGGGITNQTNGILDLYSSTITANTSNGADLNGGGGIVHFNGTTTLGNSIIAGNFGASDIGGTVTSLGHNLIGANTATGLVDGTNGDIVGDVTSPIDAMLGELADNGGRTLTHALLAGSPAIDAGNTTLATDQRNATRSVPDDIGAFNFGDTGQFIQAVAVFSHNGSADDTLDLYLNGELVASDSGPDMGLWSDGNLTGLGESGVGTLVATTRPMAAIFFSARLTVKSPSRDSMIPHFLPIRFTTIT